MPKGRKYRAYRRIEDDTPTFDRVSTDEIEHGLGAVGEPARSQVAGSPFSVAALRRKLAIDLVSRGGRPSRRQAVAVKKIPITAAEWRMLGKITQAIREDGINATPSQVAGVLLQQSLSQVSMAADGDSDPDKSQQIATTEVEQKVEEIMQAAASAKEHLEQLGPVAQELLRRMKQGRGLESDPDL